MARSWWLAVACGLLWFQPAARADVGAFYKGRTLEIHVGFGPGGGYDAYARALATAIGKHIPGRPNVIVKNVVGAGTLLLARTLQDRPQTDGLLIGTISAGLLVGPLLLPEAAGFDPRKLTWIGAPSATNYICLT